MRENHHHEAGGSATLKDPVCGMNVTTKAVHQLEYHGIHYYFCNVKCHDKFQLNPDRFISPPLQEPAPIRGNYHIAAKSDICAIKQGKI